MTLFQSCDQRNLAYLYSHKYQPQKFDLTNKKRRVIVISGPTGVGKTDLSLSLARLIDGEILSLDSMQIYRHMDIGTAKVRKEVRGEIVHHMIDICDISEHYNVVRFYHEAHLALQDILHREKVPIVVGGAGFYLRAFLYGPPLGPAKDDEIRKHLQLQMEQLGPEVLYERLQMIDPEYAKTISEKDKKKIIRALEIILITEQPVSKIPLPEKKPQGFYDFRCWFIYLPREILYPIVEMRCEQMIEKGLVDEVRFLQQKGLEENPSASQAIGYRQCLQFLHSTQTEEDWQHFVEEFKKASRHYVKKQFTWFKREPYFRWVNLDEIDIDMAKEYILQDYEQG